MYNESLIVEYFERIRERKINYIERELNIKNIENKAISIVGPRRSGKTYLLLNKYLSNKDNSIYINFESIEFSNIKPEEILNIISLYESKYNVKINTIFLDEIQNLENWNKLVRTLIDREYNIYLTGSSSRLLPKELLTELRGRTIYYILLPFSFREFLKTKVKVSKILSISDIEKIKEYLREYIKFGGYPEVIFIEDKERIIKEYYETIFYKDFIERGKIKSLNVARIIFEYLMQNFSNEISINRIKRFIENQLNINTKNTIFSYMDKIQDTMSIFFIEKYSDKFFERKRWPRKVYLCDVSFANLFGKYDIGKRMENIVYLDLLRLVNNDPLIEIYYFKDYQQHEVDFLIKENNIIKELIQVSYINNLDEIDRREIRSLIKASNLLNCNNLKIITWDLEDEIIEDNKEIKLIPLWKWLLNR
jgi:hypothetical protein